MINIALINLLINVFASIAASEYVSVAHNPETDVTLAIPLGKVTEKEAGALNLLKLILY